MSAGTRRATGLACALGAAFLLIALAPTGAAAAPPILWDSCPPGTAAGECEQPRGVAADPESGRIFLGDNFNSRVVELDALGEFVKAWGWDVVASGPGDDTTVPEDEFEICVPEDGDECQAASGGSGAGQFNRGVLGLALDSAGDVYVVDRNNRRVQKFSPAGEFLLMFGGEVNKTTGADVCTKEDLEGGDECGSGTIGAAPGEFGAWAVGDFIAIDPSDDVYVGDVERIQRFDTGGAHQDECAVPGSVQSLAVDSAGDLYRGGGGAIVKLAYATPACEDITPSEGFALPVGSASAVTVDVTGHVYAFGPPTFMGGLTRDPIIQFDPAGNVSDEFGIGEFNDSTGLATNLCAGSEVPGNLYVTNFTTGSGTHNHFVRAYGSEPIGCFKARTLPATEVEETSATLNGTINPDGELSEDCRFEWGTTTAYGETIDCAEDEATEIGAGTEPVPVHADLADLAPATTYHFRLRAKIGGEAQLGPNESFKTKGPPVISDEHVVVVTATEAVVRAQVNPEGFPTSCRVEFGTGGALDSSSASAPVGGDRSEHTVSATLGDLEPGTAYDWRFVCENTAVLDGGISEGAELALTTYRTFAADTDCPNQALRGGPSAFLPDCRAYEMVSPVDKNGADIVAGKAVESADIAAFAQAAPGGEKITYASRFPTFGEERPRSFPYNQILAGRGGGGWTNRGINQPHLGEAVDGIALGVPREPMAFTPDLCSAWLIDFQTPALNPDGQDEAANLYRRDNCAPGEGEFETITDVPLPLEGQARSEYVDQFSVQGRSADGRHALFRAKAKLTEDAAEGTNNQLYDRFGGALHVVSVLPGGEADSTDTAVGSGWRGSLQNAVSQDGSVVYWTSDIGTGVTGKLFARTSPEQGIVPGECEGVGASCTRPVSGLLPAFFWGASPDGSKALYEELSFSGGTDVYVYELEGEGGAPQKTKVAEDIEGVVGASEDLERIYVVSRAVLPESGESKGKEAVAGEPNLYLLESGEADFIATLLEGDVGQPEPGTVTAALPYNLIARDTKRRAARVAPDGGALAFQSRAPIGEFDNTSGGGKPAVEVYRYEATGDALHCVSCNPGGARPAARNLPEPFLRPGTGRPTGVVAAAWIPTWQQPTHATNVLSADGNRLFFNANDALLPRDANGTQDVYEWEAAGTGGCSEADPSYFAENGGCIYLISSGQSSFESTFWEASADGDDVFFTTEAGLVPPDPGLIDLYDAHVGGGFAYPEPRAECEGDACQSPPPPPEFDAPASGAFVGPPDLRPQADCAKQARRAKRLSQRAKRARRAARRVARTGKRRAARRLHGKARRSARGARRMSNKAQRCRRARRGGAGR